MTDKRLSEEPQERKTGKGGAVEVGGERQTTSECSRQLLSSPLQLTETS